MTPSPLWFNSEQEILVALKDLANADYSTGGKDILECMWGQSSDMTTHVVNGHKISRGTWMLFFAQMCSMTVDVIGPSFNSSEFAKMLMGKHKRYGTLSLTRWLEIGVLSRIDQKLARMKNMVDESTFDMSDETSKDTLVDIVGYCLLGAYIVHNLRE